MKICKHCGITNNLMILRNQYNVYTCNICEKCYSMLSGNKKTIKTKLKIKNKKIQTDTIKEKIINNTYPNYYTKKDIITLYGIKTYKKIEYNKKFIKTTIYEKKRHLYLKKDVEKMIKNPYIFNVGKKCLYCRKQGYVDKRGVSYNMCIECNKKISKGKNKGKKPHNKGKTLEEDYGIEKAKNIRKKQRISKIKYVEIKKNNGEPISPCVGKNETQLLNQIEIDKQIKLERQYKIIGYFLDGYCIESNTVYEVNEKYHLSEKQQIKDKIRKQNIVEHLHCKWIDIDDSGKSIWGEPVQC